MLRTLFKVLKGQIDNKLDMDTFNSQINVLSGAIRKQMDNKNFLSYLFQAFTRQSETQITRNDFVLFMQSLVPKATEADLLEVFNFYGKKNSTFMPELDAAPSRLDLAVLDTHFDKWLIENEALSGVLNRDLTKRKNQEFRQRLEAWKRRANERKRYKKRIFDQGKKIREEFQCLLGEFDLKEPIHECSAAYENMFDDLVKTRKDEKVINDLLALLHEKNVGILEISHIQALINQQQAITDATVLVMTRFVQQVQTEIPR